MAERPILFNGPMVRAILDGRKTQTRRLVKHRGEPPPAWATHGAEGQMMVHGTPEWRGSNLFYWSEEQPATGPLVTLRRWPPATEDEKCGYWIKCPYGHKKDRLWVREAHAIFNAHGQHRSDGMRWGPWGGLPTTLSPDSTLICYYREGFDRCDPGRWRPSIHMPRWASRLTLEIVSVRVQRLQDITEEDARAEGANPKDAALVFADDADGHAHMQQELNGTARGAFAVKWDAINAKRAPWSSNPWVWVIEFKRAEERRARG